MKKSNKSTDSGMDGHGPPPPVPTFGDVAEARLQGLDGSVMVRQPTPRPPIDSATYQEPPPLGTARPIPIPGSGVSLQSNGSESGAKASDQGRSQADSPMYHVLLDQEF